MIGFGRWGTGLLRVIGLADAILARVRIRARKRGDAMRRELSHEEVKATMRGLAGSIDAYAELLVRKGAAVQPGQELVVTAPVERADFARIVVRKAYEAGAGNVTMLWSDDVISRLSYDNHDQAFFETVPAWKRTQLNDLAEAGAAFLFLHGADPNGLMGVDPVKIATSSRAHNEQCKTYRSGMDYGHNAWCIAGVPVGAWARMVFPDCAEDEAILHLWEAILYTARADGPDPQQEWERHNAMFEKNKRILNDYAFDHLRYRSVNGTDFTIGMNRGHVWQGGAGVTVGGRVFFPNMPTEEVFTTPDRMRADGVVHSAMPLVHAGHVVRDFWLRFEAGKVVDLGAAEGEEVLRSIVESDETSNRLGECALVAKDTPIRQSGLLFYNTLYDENASCHLALGTGFPECLEGGFDMSADELMAHGVNRSTTHVDFMVGSDDLEIVGVTSDGEEVPIFVDGRWAWSVE